MPLFNFLKTNLSILDLISEYVPLKQAGNYWKGPCPFHYEKEASFTVSPDKQIFYCFGCHAKGDLISFVAKKENLSQVEAAKYLIDKYQIELPAQIKESFSKNFNANLNEKNNYFNACKFFANWLHEKLIETPDALNYLNARNIDSQDIKYFKIGYFPGGARNIGNLLKLASSSGLMAKDFIDAGILVQNNSVIYSPFEERIVFPIYDIMSRNVGFGGRVFRSGDDRAKYYNSKESLWFLKGKLLFGLDIAKQYMQEKKYVFLVEGYTDCVAMAKYGYKNVVATLGTACTVEHLRLISRYVDTVYVLYDGDSAGQAAMLRLTQLCWDVNLELKILKLPEKQDPADFLISGNNLDLLVENANTVFEFFIDSTGSNFLNLTLAEQMVVGRNILNLIAKIDDSLKREILINRAAKHMGMQATSIASMVFEEKSKFITNTQDNNITNNKYIKPSESLDSDLKIPVLEERIFSAIINSFNGPEMFFIPGYLIEYFSKDIQLLLKIVGDFITNSGCATKDTELQKKFDSFINTVDPEYKDWLIACSLKYEPIKTKEAFDDLVAIFFKKNWKEIVQDVKIKMQKAKSEGNEERVKDLLNLFTQLKRGLI